MNWELEKWNKTAARLQACAAELLFPRRCLYCGEIVLPRGELICTDCVGKLPYIRGRRCAVCGRELPEGGKVHGRPLCRRCSTYSRAVKRGFCLLRYDGVSAEIMAGLKYHHKKEYADGLGWLLYEAFGGLLQELSPEALIPVPVHKKRRRVRGYNQAEEICRSLSAFLRGDEKELIRMGLPAERIRNVQERNTVQRRALTQNGSRFQKGPSGERASFAALGEAGKESREMGERVPFQMESGMLLRKKNTKALKNLSADERIFSLQNAFYVPKEQEAVLKRMKTVVLVDDIYTTGATIEACASALLRAGAGRVYSLCVCAGRDT